MAMYKTVEVDVDIDLEEFDTEELVEELEKRGIEEGSHAEFKRVVSEMYELYTSNKIYQIDEAAPLASITLNPELDRRLVRLFDIVLGRIA